jgi:hypothetical protein
VIKKLFFLTVLAGGVLLWGLTIGEAQGLSADAKAQLCSEKKAGLAKLEAEAPALHAQVAKLEKDYAAASMAETEALGLAGDRVRTGGSGFLGDAADKGAFGLVGAATLARESVAKQLASARAREKHVASQIFLLRDIIEGLGCGTPAPPVDYNAIDQLGQQSQQSMPGATSGTSGGTSGGQSVQQQGSGYTAPTSGFGSSGASTQTSGSQGQYPGYGPGPYGTGSAPFPTHQEILQGVQGSIGEKPGMGKPGGG